MAIITVCDAHCDRGPLLNSGDRGSRTPGEVHPLNPHLARRAPKSGRSIWLFRHFRLDICAPNGNHRSSITARALPTVLRVMVATRFPARGRPGRHRVIWDVLSHNGTRTDDHPVADADPAEDRRTGADQHVVADCRLSWLRPVTQGHPLVDAEVAADPHIGSDDNPHTVHQTQAGSELRPWTDLSAAGTDCPALQQHCQRNQPLRCQSVPSAVVDDSPDTRYQEGLGDHLKPPPDAGLVGCFDHVAQVVHEQCAYRMSFSHAKSPIGCPSVADCNQIWGTRLSDRASDDETPHTTRR